MIKFHASKGINTAIIAIFASLSVNAAEVVSMRDFQGTVKNINAVNSMFKPADRSTSDVTFKKVSAERSDTAKYEQFYKNIPVWGHSVVIRADKNGVIDRLHGYAVKGLEKDITSVDAKISENDAIMTARAYHEETKGNKGNWGYDQLTSGQVIFVDSQNKAHLAYVVSFYADLIKSGQPTRPDIIVDAMTGKVLRYTNKLATGFTTASGPGGNKTTGQYNYTNIEVYQNGTTCTLDNGYVMTIDLNNQGSLENYETEVLNDTAFSFACPFNNARPINDAYSPLNDAHVNGTATLKTYISWFGFSPLKDKLKMRVHYGKDFENAFWDGKQMTFGDGGKNLYPLSTALDVTAHEISHGFTNFNSNLDYRSESGGINEAFSDIAGEAVEYFTRGKADWKVGAEVIKPGGQVKDALRFMDDPSKDKMSLVDASKFKWPAQCDMLLEKSGSVFGQLIYIMMCTDMHFSSGLYNKAFYTIANSPHYDMQKAFSIFVRANQKYWTQKTTFVDGAKGVRDAAADLGYNTTVVVDAFAQVGIKL